MIKFLYIGNFVVKQGIIFLKEDLQHKELQSVVGQMHILGKSLLHIGMTSHFVTDVSEICFLRFHFGDKFQGLLNIEV